MIRPKSLFPQLQEVSTSHALWAAQCGSICRSSGTEIDFSHRWTALRNIQKPTYNAVSSFPFIHPWGFCVHRKWKSISLYVLFPSSISTNSLKMEKKKSLKVNLTLRTRERANTQLLLVDCLKGEAFAASNVQHYWGYIRPRLQPNNTISILKLYDLKCWCSNILL